MLDGFVVVIGLEGACALGRTTSPKVPPLLSDETPLTLH